MDYRGIYDKLIESRKHRGLDKSKYDGYFEIHHIVPVSVGGTNEDSNLVMLTGREHFLAHMLLWKIHPQNASLVYAASMMCNRFGERVNSKTYSTLKEDFCKAISEKTRGKRFKDITGLRFGRLLAIELDGYYASPGHRRHAQWLCTCDCGGEIVVSTNSLITGNTRSCGCLATERKQSLTGNKNPFYGKKHTEETRKKFKTRKVKRGEEHPRFGKKASEETRRKMSAASKGRKWAPGRRETQNFPRGENHWNFGGKMSKESIEKLRETHLSKNIRPWETTGTHNESSMTKWAMMDFYYEVWKESGELALKRFTKYYNYVFEDNVSLAFFTNPIIQFRKGWNPEKDLEWVKFSEKFWLKNTP